MVRVSRLTRSRGAYIRLSNSLVRPNCFSSRAAHFLSPALSACACLYLSLVQAFVYGDNVTGWNITSAEQLEYNKWIADQVGK